MHLLIANPTLRVQVLFPKSIHNQFCFWQIDINVKERLNVWETDDKQMFGILCSMNDLNN